MSTVDRTSFSLFIEYECLVFSLGTSPPSAALWWNSGVRQSQKQRKRSKSSTSDESSSNLKGTEGNARDVTPDERKDKEAAPAWYVPLLSFTYLSTFSFSTSPLWLGEDLKDVNKVYKCTFPSQEEKGMVSMWCVGLSIPFVWNTRRSRQFSDFINTKCFFLDLNSFKGISLHTLRLPIITVLFIMFIFPSKLKLNLSGVLLNLKRIIKIWFLFYFSHTL